MTTELKKLELRAGYIYLRYDGSIKKKDQMEPEHAYEQFVDFFKKNPSDKLLLDCSRVDYEVDILKEHTFGEMVTPRLSPFKKIAVVASKSVAPRHLHLENVLYNRGINFRAFWNLAEAVKWLQDDAE